MNVPIEKRARLFESSHEIVKQRDDALVREIMVLNLSGQPEKSVEYLAESNFHFREGSSRVRDITVDAHLLLGKQFFAGQEYDKALEQFLQALGDSRSAQICYFIGAAFEALGDQSKADENYNLSTEEVLKGDNYTRYYQGLSYLKVGNKNKANEYFNALIEEGKKVIDQGSEVDFFAKFGELESENVQLSNAYLNIGLGYKGLGDHKLADDNLRKSVELSASNLWANIEWKEN
jgi:tetratricopeptide (TPR) repeat protein